MADDEQFSLCWNNFNTNLSAGFHESLCRGDLVDVSLAAEGQIVKAHRLVLSVCSPFFRKMFTQMPPNAHAFVFLNNVSHSALKDLIQFMYCGEVNVKQDALPAFISTAESLQIKGLTDNDPAPQPPQEPTPPPPAAPHVQQQQQQVPTQRVQRQQPRASARYKIETVDDVLGDDKGTTQIVIQTTTAPQATIVQQQQQQQQQQQTQHIQTQQQLQTGTTTTATLVSTNKRTAQRGSLVGSGNVKRSKTTTTTANVIDPLDTTPDTATTTTTAQQLASQQITVQTTVVPSETKVHQVRQQQAAAQEEAEYIDLPMELPTKSEPDYSEDHAEVAGDGDTTYVEDDTYGDMRYDDSYFTENEDAGAQTAGGNTSAANVSATTSKAVVKQQSQSYSDSSFVDTGADQGNTEAQAFHIDFADSKKNGGKLLVINGFRFFRNKKRGHLQYWKCRNYYKERCPAIAIHDESTLILRLCHQHQHMESNDIEIKPLPSTAKEELPEVEAPSLSPPATQPPPEQTRSLSPGRSPPPLHEYKTNKQCFEF
ncbi:modifier of mdg4-like isoform X7 [Drosophila sulfurigaster albostrigata]|uniref:modifier of mdg4-like isoform X7 n=1 Tax=Drosophila sulfurigaster albostrigata TaxID=89887 RepID=UPI002D21BC8A|nr:modifier of mdg4-like isoform X7 [Drosophila sulfurigaster albostrigata]